MAMRIICAGHICLDITPVFPEGGLFHSPAQLLEPGKLIQMRPADVHTGGSVANTGLALKKLGADVQLMGKVGRDAFGSMVQSIAAGYGADGLVVDETGSTSYSVVLAIPGIDRIFLHHPGANDTFSSEDIPTQALQGAQLFHFGYPPLMKRMYQNGGEELETLFRRVKAQGVATSLDLAAVDPASEAGRADWNALLRQVLPYTDFFVPSFEELCFMLDRPRYQALAARGGDMTAGLDLWRDVRPLGRMALEMGAGVVLIKCGTAGMYYAAAGAGQLAGLPIAADGWAGQEGVQRCFRAEKVLSATGAGDTSIAAFLYAALLGKPVAQAVALAAAEGACAVTAYDALSGLKTLPQLEKEIAAGWPTV